MHLQSRSFSSLILSMAVVALFGAAASLPLSAQATQAANKPLDLKASLMKPIDLSRPADLNYSSSVGVEETAAADGLNFGGSETQPPPRRRRYGRPNYSDRMHNPDGSKKYVFEVGGGFDTPTGSTGKDLTVNWKLQAGVGYNFNKRFGVMLEYNYDKFNDSSSNLLRQYNRYNSLGVVDENGNLVNFAGLDGTTHVWSFTVNPMYTYYQGESFGAYVIGGGGFYRKVSNFTLPRAGYYCDYFGFCYSFTSNQVFDHYSNNAGGLNGGLGFTYKMGRFSSSQLYAEARYAWVNNQPSQNSVGGLYPENNKRTGYFPVTVGLRF
ncbi:MAG TPA: hypothetical protein VIM60_04180 [Edaphobacter sp.]